MKLNEHVEIAGQVQTSPRSCVVVTVESHDARCFVALTSFYRPLDERIRGWLTGHRVVLSAAQASEVAALLNSIGMPAERDPLVLLPPSGRFPSAATRATLTSSGRTSTSLGASR
jgi:hypothetical protein